MICCACTIFLTGSAVAVTIIDDFGATILSPRWTLHDSPASYGSGGGFSLDGSYARFSSVRANGYAHLETPVDANGPSRYKYPA